MLTTKLFLPLLGLFGPFIVAAFLMPWIKKRERAERKGRENPCLYDLEKDVSTLNFRR